MTMLRGITTVGIALFLLLSYSGNATAEESYFTFAAASDQGQIDHLTCLSEAESDAEMDAIIENSRRYAKQAQGVTNHVTSGQLGRQAMTDGFKHFVPGWGLYASTKRVTNSFSENSGVADPVAVTTAESQLLADEAYKKCMGLRGHKITSSGP